MDFLKRITGNKDDAAASQPGAPETAQAPRVEPTHLTGEDFDKALAESQVPVIVDFWAEWCGPCHAIAPSVSRLAQEYAGRAFVGKVDADEYPDILSRYGIMGIPTLIYFKGGQEVDRVIGLNPYGTLKAKLERLLA